MRKLSLRERVLLILLCILAVISGYMLFFRLPVSAQMESLRGQIDQDSETVAQLEARLAQQRSMEETLASLQSQPDAPVPMPEYDNIQAVMLELNDILSGCQAYTISFGAVQPQEGSNVVCRQVTIPFTCADYQGAIAVLQRLHDSSLRCLLEDVELSQESQGPVQVTATLTFFEYQQSED